MAARLALSCAFFCRVPFQGHRGVCPVVLRKPSSHEDAVRTGFQCRSPRSSNRAGVQGGTATLSSSSVGEIATSAGHHRIEAQECGNMSDALWQAPTSMPAAQADCGRWGHCVCDAKPNCATRMWPFLQRTNVPSKSWLANSTEPRSATCSRQSPEVRSQCRRYGNDLRSTLTWCCPSRELGSTRNESMRAAAQRAMPADYRRPRNWEPLERRSCGVHVSTFCGWLRRWTRMLSISSARVFASSLVGSRSEGPEVRMAQLPTCVEGGRFLFSSFRKKAKKNAPASSGEWSFNVLVTDDICFG